MCESRVQPRSLPSNIRPMSMVMFPLGVPLPVYGKLTWDLAHIVPGNDPGTICVGPHQMLSDEILCRASRDVVSQPSDLLQKELTKGKV